MLLVLKVSSVVLTVDDWLGLLLMISSVILMVDEGSRNVLNLKQYCKCLEILALYMGLGGCKFMQVLVDLI